MTIVKDPPETQYIIQEIDRLIAEMAALRDQVAARNNPSPQPHRSVRSAEYFGMWADREDMHGQSSRKWLDDLRARQWTRP